VEKTWLLEKYQKLFDFSFTEGMNVQKTFEIEIHPQCAYQHRQKILRSKHFYFTVKTDIIYKSTDSMINELYY